MRIVASYSFNGGEEAVKSKYQDLLREIEEIIGGVHAEKHKVKKSREKTMRGKILYSPASLNSSFKRQFKKRGWNTIRVKCTYPTEYYVNGYKPPRLNRGAFREMDFVKKRLGIEVQFGKYAFMVYNVSAKMTIFHKLGYIDTGMEIVPVKNFVRQMSSGVSYFEQFVWDLQHRGASNIDIPVMVLGIDSSATP